MQDLKTVIETLGSELNGLMAKANLTAEQTKTVHDVINNGKSALNLLSVAGLDDSQLADKLREVEQMQKENQEKLRKWG